MSLSPRHLVEQIEAAPALPPGLDERFNGYGVMGLPFISGHVLAMRRFPATSVGPGYTSVWHRNPQGEWVFYATAAPHLACSRYFGRDALASIQTEVRIIWLAPARFRVLVPAASLEWEVAVGPTVATRLMNGMARLLPGGSVAQPGLPCRHEQHGWARLRCGSRWSLRHCAERPALHRQSTRLVSRRG